MNLQETIKEAIKIKEFYSLSFVTIWQTNKSFGFNFDNKAIGYELKKEGIMRKVVGIY